MRRIAPRFASCLASRAPQMSARLFSSSSPAPEEPSVENLGPISFIERAKLLGANAILGSFKFSNGFDKNMTGLTVDRIAPGKVTCSIVVTKDLSNAYGTLHGGAISTLIDIVGTIALISVDPTRAGVSVELNTSFISAAKIGEKVVMEGQVLKLGKRLGFTEVNVKKEDGSLIATGRHTKAM